MIDGLFPVSFSFNFSALSSKYSLIDMNSSKYLHKPRISLPYPKSFAWLLPENLQVWSPFTRLAFKAGCYPEAYPSL